MPNVEYKLEDGVLWREDKRRKQKSHLGTFDGENIVYNPGMRRYHLPVAKLLKELGKRYESVDERTPGQPVAVKEPEPETDVSWDAKLEPRVAQAVRKLRALQGFPEKVESTPPPAPHTTSGAGDKHPPYMEWLLRYHPDKFARKYGILGIGSIEVMKIVQNPRTGEARRVRVREDGHILATRNTYLTELRDNIAFAEMEKGGVL